jgi:tetratricopeptide (TPR) repeat protein
LVAALEADEHDGVAAGLLGMLLYDAGRRTEALALWVHAIESGSLDPIVHRNAGLASYNVAHDDEAAVRHYESALALDPSNARLVFERNQLAQRLGEPEPQRLGRLEQHLAEVLVRDDLVVDYADLLVSAGRAQQALDLLNARVFQPWEGGEGRVLGAWDRARTALGLPQGEPPRSLGEARTAFVPPVARHDTGKTDYFATSLPELLLFSRE